MGLGGGLCVHVLRDGTALEMIGRLCLSEGRNESIQKAIEMAEPRQQRPKTSALTMSEILTAGEIPLHQRWDEESMIAPFECYVASLFAPRSGKVNQVLQTAKSR